MAAGACRPPLGEGHLALLICGHAKARHHDVVRAVRRSAVQLLWMVLASRVADSLAASGEIWEYTSAVMVIEEWPSLRLTSSSDSPLARPSDAEACRRSCKRIFGRPALATSTSKCRDTEAGFSGFPSGVVKTGWSSGSPSPVGGLFRISR